VVRHTVLPKKLHSLGQAYPFVLNINRGVVGRR